MRPAPAAIVVALSLGLAATALAESKKIDLRTKDGVAAIKGEWRYSDVKLVEVPGTDPANKGATTYSYEPKATGPAFDDSAWPVIDPTTLGKPRGNGLICFVWYRIKVTVPESARGKTVFFSTVVDDYGEVWVDGKLPRAGGQTGGAIVAGFNAANRLELKGAEPGKVFNIAVFGINGPISAGVTNRIFLGPTTLELAD